MDSDLKEFAIFKDYDPEKELGVVWTYVKLGEMKLERNKIIEFITSSFKNMKCKHPYWGWLASWYDKDSQYAYCSLHERFMNGNFVELDEIILDLKRKLISVEYDLVYLNDRYLFF